MIHSKEILKYTQNLNILVVEDHSELLETISSMLQNFFQNVTKAENGNVALELYKNNYSDKSTQFDIVLSDIQMPFLNGVDLTKEIYNLNPSQSIIIISAYDESKYLLPLINLGIEQFIKKPIDYQELLEAIFNCAKKISVKHDIITPSIKIQFNNNSFFNKENSALYVDNQNIYLTKYEIIFLQLLSNIVGKIYSNQDISNFYTDSNENMDAQNIRKLVSKLRKKLPENSLASVYAIGYKIVPFFPNDTDS